MEQALEKMELELPDDVKALGAEARRHVASCLRRLSAGETDPGRLSNTIERISGLMDTLTERLLFAPFDESDPRKN
jgi:hypothetical protein